MVSTITFSTGKILHCWKNETAKTWMFTSDIAKETTSSCLGLRPVTSLKSAKWARRNALKCFYGHSRHPCPSQTSELKEIWILNHSQAKMMQSIALKDKASWFFAQKTQMIQCALVTWFPRRTPPPPPPHPLFSSFILKTNPELLKHTRS